MTWDLVIVGAGPAGLACAARAAGLGLRVLVADRKSAVGAPVRCGEGLGIKAFVEAGLTPDGPWKRAEVVRFHFHGPGTEATIRSPDRSFDFVVMDRDRLEYELARLAVEAGAHLRLRAPVDALVRSGERPNGSLAEEPVGTGRLSLVEGVRVGGVWERCRAVVACDGVESRVARWAGLDTRLKPSEVGGCVQATCVAGPGSRLEVEGDLSHLFVGGPYAPGGYAWVFPKGNLVNVGVGVPMSGASPRDLLAKFMEERFPGAHPVRVLAGCVPLARPLEGAGRGNVLVAGDAARFPNPILGAGIRSALLSGRLAAESAAGALGDGGTAEAWAGALRAYDDACDRGFRAAVRRRYWLKDRVLSDDDRLRRGFILLRLGSLIARTVPVPAQRRIFGGFAY